MSQGLPSQRLRPFKPQRFGRYTLLMPISTGGMGEVFLARLEGAHGFDKLCVIKKILPHLAEDPEFTERFVNEARVLVKLSHGNIAQVLDMGLFEQAPYIALEFIDGKDLRLILARMRDRQLPIPLSFVLFVMTRVLDALAYAHRKVGDDERELNLVHRDVSPQNVLISYDGEVKVIDFGLAKSTLSNAKTNPSIILGKFMYMSPEQARHQKADRRSDLYSVGLCLYELISGRSPFDEVPPADLMIKVAAPGIASLNTVEPMCPPPLSDAVMKALSVDPEHRWQTAEEFRGRLQLILNDLDPSAGGETARRFMRDAFATEYGAERKMLAALKEQAKNLDDDDDDEATIAERTNDTKTDLNEALRLPVPMAVPAVIHPEPTSEQDEHAEPESDFDSSTALTEALSLEPTALSFEPTKKTVSAVRRSAEKGDADVESHTHPSIPLRARDTDERLDPVTGAPSVLLDGVEALPAGDDSRGAKTLPAMPAVQVDDEQHTPMYPPKKLSGSRPSVTRASSAPARVRSDPKRTSVAAKAAPKPVARQRPGSSKVWLVLPVLAVIAVGSYIAWDVYTERLKEAQLEAAAATPVKKNKASKAARAFASLKSDYERLHVGPAQKRFRAELDALGGQVNAPGDEAAFVKAVDALHASVSAELEKQE